MSGLILFKINGINEYKYHKNTMFQTITAFIIQYMISKNGTLNIEPDPLGWLSSQLVYSRKMLYIEERIVLEALIDATAIKRCARGPWVGEPCLLYGVLGSKEIWMWIFFIIKSGPSFRVLFLQSGSNLGIFFLSNCI